jgi:rhodanese-related sulfurtransferase
MFGGKSWKSQLALHLQEIDQQIANLQRADQELKNQNLRLLEILKNVGRKLVSRLPISLESLEKGLDYDLIFPEEVETWRVSVGSGILLDTRSANDFAKAFIRGAINLPLEQLNARMDSLSKDHPILLICENGIKSVAACEQLRAKGYHYLYVLKGGMSLYRGETLSHLTSAPIPDEETFSSITT